MSFIIDLTTQEHLPLPLHYILHYTKDVVMKTICALLNGDGGWIIVGASSDYKFDGLANEHIEDELQQAITNTISPIPLVYIQKEQAYGNTVLLITVMKGSLRPYAFNGRFYLMVGDSVVVPNTQQLSMLLRTDNFGQDKWELKTCLQAEDSDIDDSLMNSVYLKGKDLKRVINNDEEHLFATLKRLRLLGSSTVANGAMALFGSNTTLFLKQCRVRIQLMLNGKTADSYQDVQNIEDNMFNTHQRVLEYFERLPLTASFSDKKGYRKESYFYPLDVIDEAITNALIHRSYDGFLDEITIFIFRDRIEIANPGEMLGKFISNGKVIPHGSVLRNPVMAEVFYMSGLMEKSGRGLSLIYNGMLDKGFKKPTWKSENGKTTLTIYSSKIKAATLNDRMTQFLSGHNIGEFFTKADYMRRFESISKVTAQTDIQKLVDLSYCVSKGNGPSTKYLITKTDR